MKLKYITLTGADNTIHPERLLEISQQYADVEWGILFSKKKMGSPRYPSRSWLDLFKDYTINLQTSAHLCGEYSLKMQEGTLNIDPFNGHFNRVQINMTDDGFMKLDINVLKIYYIQHPNIEIILQTKRPFERLELLEIPNTTFLYDISGGKGILPNKYPKPPINKIVGYAGGLGPKNLKEQLKILNDCVEKSIIWIDAETNLRTNNKFDLDKCKQFLDICYEGNYI